MSIFFLNSFLSFSFAWSQLPPPYPTPTIYWTINTIVKHGLSVIFYFSTIFSVHSKNKPIVERILVILIQNPYVMPITTFFFFFFFFHILSVRDILSINLNNLQFLFDFIFNFCFFCFWFLFFLSFILFFHVIPFCNLIWWEGGCL